MEKYIWHKKLQKMTKNIMSFFIIFRKQKNRVKFVFVVYRGMRKSLLRGLGTNGRRAPGAEMAGMAKTGVWGKLPPFHLLAYGYKGF